jgi:hypothetical protein
MREEHLCLKLDVTPQPYEMRRNVMYSVKTIARLVGTASALTVLLGLGTLSAHAEARTMLLYNASTGAALHGYLTDDNTYQAITIYPPGSYAPGWSHIVALETGINVGSATLFYDRDTGATCWGRIDLATTCYVLGQGWTHITYHEGMTFFYARDSDLAAIVQFHNDGSYTQWQTYWNTFSKHWTHIVSTSGYLLFYNQDNGEAAIGRLDYHYYGGLGAALSGVSFTKVRDYPPGSFSTGWDHIVATSEGTLFFYNAHTGLQVTGMLDSAGNYGDMPMPASPIRSGWTDIAAVGEKLFFYDALSAEAAIGEIIGYSPYVVAHVVGSLAMKSDVFSLPDGAYLWDWTDTTHLAVSTTYLLN